MAPLPTVRYLWIYVPLLELPILADFDPLPFPEYGSVRNWLKRTINTTGIGKRWTPPNNPNADPRSAPILPSVLAAPETPRLITPNRSFSSSDTPISFFRCTSSSPHGPPSDDANLDLDSYNPDTSRWTFGDEPSSLFGQFTYEDIDWQPGFEGCSALEALWEYGSDASDGVPSDESPKRLPSKFGRAVAGE